jgi:hypothetical protein
VDELLWIEGDTDSRDVEGPEVPSDLVATAGDVKGVDDGGGFRMVRDMDGVRPWGLFLGFGVLEALDFLFETVLLPPSWSFLWIRSVLA